ncbi:MAG: M13 family metallopeptidase [Sphingomicrobium sp.]|nr:M13 family metallopeptidase [Sphingomonadales bacterium]
MTRRAIFLAASAIALLPLAACSQGSDKGGTEATAAKGSQSGIDVAAMDKSVAPGDDFDKYTNGSWEKNSEIPADKSNISSFSVVNDIAEKRTADLIAGIAKTNPTSGDEAKIANFYNAYLDTNAIEQKGAAALKADIDRIEAIADKGALAEAIGGSIRADTDPFNNNNYNSENLFGIFTTQSLNDPKTTVPYLMQGGIGLPDRDYYLSSDPAMVKIRDAYGPYVAKMMTLAGIPDAAARAAKVVALERQIAEAQESINDSQDSVKGNNPWKRADLDRKAPGLDWNRLLGAAKLGQQQDFIVWQPGTVTKLSALVASQPFEVWRDWLAFHRANQMTDALPNAFDDAHFAFYGATLSGQPQQRTRDKRALAATSRWLGDAVGKRYVDKFFPASSKSDIERMVTGIKAAFEKKIDGLTWMAAPTKAEAKRKVATMAVGIGYSDKWHDYANFNVRAGDAYGNLDRARRANYEMQIAKIGQPVDKTEWWMTPQTVNALNLPLQNALNFPAAILDKGFYDAAADPAANYGAIGSVIGHEISHSFDNLGATFDAEGRLRNWWTPADLAHFQAAGKALADQYSAYEALPGLHLNGKQELGENIADVAGLSAAYDAYHASLNGKPAPVIDGMSGDQRFFIAYGQSHRGKLRDAALRARIATDVHAPGPWRVLTVRNLDPWYAAFKAPATTKLYLAPDKRVKIW